MSHRERANLGIIGVLRLAVEALGQAPRVALGVPFVFTLKRSIAAVHEPLEIARLFHGPFHWQGDASGFCQFIEVRLDFPECFQRKLRRILEILIVGKLH